MPTLNQSNEITLQEIHTRTELWKDHIYYISNNPYWNRDYQFLPLPRRFAETLQEFREAVQKQKDSELQDKEQKLEQLRDIIENDNNKELKPKSNDFPTGWVIGVVLLVIIGLAALFIIKSKKKKKLTR